MIQMKVFEAASRVEIERQFNAWAASLIPGVQMPGVGPTTREDDVFVKEVLYVLPVRSNIAVPTPAIARGNGR